jgi:hypothetical protein
MIKCISSFCRYITPIGEAATKREDRCSTKNLCVIHDDPSAAKVQRERGDHRGSQVQGHWWRTIQRAVVASERQETWCDELKGPQIRARSSLLSIEIVAIPGTPTWTQLIEWLKTIIPENVQLVKWPEQSGQGCFEVLPLLVIAQSIQHNAQPIIAPFPVANSLPAASMQRLHAVGNPRLDLIHPVVALRHNVCQPDRGGPAQARSLPVAMGLEPATACLEGRRSRSRRSPALHRPHRRFHTMNMQCERAWQKMLRTRRGRRSHCCPNYTFSLSPLTRAS